MNPSDSRDPSPVVQFQLRQVLIFVTVSAVVLAFVTPVIRRLPKDVQVPALWQLGLLLTMVTGSVMSTGFQRRRIVVSSGALLRRFDNPFTTTGERWLTIVLVFGWLFVIMDFVLPIFFLSLGPRRSATFPIGAIAQVYLLTNLLLTRVWWKLDPRGIEVCEGAIVLGSFRSIPWNTIKRVSWHETKESHRASRTIPFDLYLHSHSVLNLTVAAHHASELRALIETKLS